MFGVAIFFHFSEVSSHTFSTDQTSPGWLGLRGPAGFASDIIVLSPLHVLPRTIGTVLAILPLLGWYAFGRTNWLPFLWFATMFTLIAVCARSDNFYWGMILMPTYLAGLAFVPRYLLIELRPRA